SARLLDRVHGHRLAELYQVEFATTARHADPHPAGVVESLLLTEGRLLVGPADAPVELSAGDFVRFPGDVPHLYQALGGPAGGGGAPRGWACRCRRASWCRWATSNNPAASLSPSGRWPATWTRRPRSPARSTWSGRRGRAASSSSPNWTGSPGSR